MNMFIYAYMIITEFNLIITWAEFYGQQNVLLFNCPY